MSNSKEGWVTAPFTPGQVERLKERQNDPRLHEYTCGGANKRHCMRRRNTNGHFFGTYEQNNGILTPTTNGWVCPCGEYTQPHALAADAGDE